MSTPRRAQGAPVTGGGETTRLLAIALGAVVALSACGAGSSVARLPTATSTSLAPRDPARLPATGDDAEVARVTDGDTIRVRLVGGGEVAVRLIGVDTPESVKPNAAVECFGQEAARYLLGLLPIGEQVRLLYDVERTDRYGRTLAYVYRLRDGLFVNLALAHAGYAEVLTVPPNVAHAEQFRGAVAEARERPGVGCGRRAERADADGALRDSSSMALAALLVAVLALAVSAWSAWNQHQSERRHRRQLLDQAAPAVRVVGPEPRRERWAPPRPGSIPAELGVIPPDTEYVMPRQAGQAILLGADVLLVNEGQASAVVRFGGLGGFNEGVGGFTSWFGPGENAKLPYAQADGSYVLAPATKCLLLLRDGHTAEEWLADPQRPVRIEVSAATVGGAGVEDRWLVELRGPVLSEVHEDASHWRVVPHTPVEARVEQLPRRYPGK